MTRTSTIVATWLCLIGRSGSRETPRRASRPAPFAAPLSTSRVWPCPASPSRSRPQRCRDSAPRRPPPTAPTSFRQLPAGDYEIAFETTRSRPRSGRQRAARPDGRAERHAAGRRRAPSRCRSSPRRRRRSPRRPSAPTSSTTKSKRSPRRARSSASRTCRRVSPTNTPNAGQVTINGAFAFDNVFMVNGVDVNDNLFGSPQNLFIEDAIEETQVLTSGITRRVRPLHRRRRQRHHQERRQHLLGQLPAQPHQPAPGRTRRRSSVRHGGHDARQSTARTTNVTRARFGGPIVKDRLWFFGAGRACESRPRTARCRRPASPTTQQTTTSAARSSSPAPPRRTTRCRAGI